MKKVFYRTFIVGIVFLSLFLILFVNNNYNKTFIQDGVLFALTLDGKKISSFPDYSTGKYTIKTNCQNGIGKFLPVETDDKDYKLSFILSEITGNVTCFIDFKTKTNANNLKNIVETVNTNQNYNYHGFRYSGKNPNNYVWFNDEMWRIIGSIPTKIDSTGKVENLVKIIRDESIGGLAYDAKASGYTSIWGENTLYTLLNSYYYGADDATNTSFCYSYNATVKSKCDYTYKGITPTDYYGKMVKQVYWNTGVSGYKVNAKTAYNSEVENQTLYGYVGLMSVSDYGYATLSNYHNEIVDEYNLDAIRSTNWLLYQDDEWTIVSYNLQNNTRLLHIEDGGGVYYINTNVGFMVRPVVYLDSSVYVVSGSGTITNPYIIAM